MMNVKRRRYYQYAEKETREISLKWKGIHMILFGLIVINSFIATFGFQSILSMFSNRCILYGHPHFELTDVHHHHLKDVSVEQNNVTVEQGPSAVEQNNVTVEQGPSAVEQSNVTASQELNGTKDVTNDEIAFLKLNVRRAQNVELRESKFWYVNGSMEGRIVIDLRRTDYVSLVMCEVVIFNTMISLLLALFLGVMVGICARGGKGYRRDILPQPWLYVYPVLIVSAVMAVVCIITTNTVINGLQHFCSHFEEFTNENTCTDLITYFTFQHGTFRDDFHNLYMVCLYTFNIETILWVLQLIITLLRILCVVDFQLHSITVGCKHEEEQAVHQVLVNTVPGLKEDKSFVSEEDNTTEPKQQTTQL